MPTPFATAKAMALVGLFASLAAVSPAHAAPTACDLITQAQAAAVFGAQVQAGTEAGAAGSDTCLFEAQDNEHSVSLTVLSFASANTAKMMLGALDRPQPGVTSTPIAGLGESAVYNASETEGSVWILYHNQVFALDGNNTSNPNLKAAILQTARQVLGKK